MPPSICEKMAELRLCRYRLRPKLTMKSNRKSEGIEIVRTTPTPSLAFIL